MARSDYVRVGRVAYLGHMSTQTHHHIPEWTLGDRLRKAREDAGMDQAALAEALGVSRATISNHEVGIGKRGTSRMMIRAWALATGVPAEWIELGTAPDQKPPGYRLALVPAHAA